MELNLTPEEREEATHSIRRYLSEELETEISDLQAGFLLKFFAREIGPFAYNKGVEDARQYFHAKAEDLSGTCFEEGLTFWRRGKNASREVRRKPGG